MPFATSFVQMQPHFMPNSTTAMPATSLIGLAPFQSSAFGPMSTAQTHLAAPNSFPHPSAFASPSSTDFRLWNVTPNSSTLSTTVFTSAPTSDMRSSTAGAVGVGADRNLLGRPQTLDFKNAASASHFTSGSIVPKLPLQLTKSIEEMLRPATDDGSSWNKPLAMDWAELKVSTPSFDREIVARFFPECASSSESSVQ